MNICLVLVRPITQRTFHVHSLNFPMHLLYFLIHQSFDIILEGVPYFLNRIASLGLRVFGCLILLGRDKVIPRVSLYTCTRVWLGRGVIFIASSSTTYHICLDCNIISSFISHTTCVACDCIFDMHVTHHFVGCFPSFGWALPCHLVQGSNIMFIGCIYGIGFSFLSTSVPDILACY